MKFQPSTILNTLRTNTGLLDLFNTDHEEISSSSSSLFLAVQAFIPEIWAGQRDQDQLIAFKSNYLHGWMSQQVPVILDVSPGYDAHVVFPGSKQYGYNQYWRAGLSALQTEEIRGITFNAWNGYTEGLVAVPTHEYRDTAFRWLQQPFKESSPQITVLYEPVVTIGQ